MLSSLHTHQIEVTDCVPSRKKCTRKLHIELHFMPLNRKRRDQFSRLLLHPFIKHLKLNKSFSRKNCKWYTSVCTIQSNIQGTTLYINCSFRFYVRNCFVKSNVNESSSMLGLVIFLKYCLSSARIVASWLCQKNFNISKSDEELK